MAGVQELTAAEVVVPGDEKRGDELHGHGADVQQADADEHVQVVQAQADGGEHREDDEFAAAAHVLFVHEDVLHGQDVVNLYFKSKDVEAAYGQAFNIGGGVENSLSLLELFEILEQKLDIKMNYREIDWRESDQKVFIADIKKAVDIIDWTPEVSKEVGLDRMLNWLQK